MSWEQAWTEGRTKWDAGASPPVLRALVASTALPSGRALVPGCGSGYDVLTLAAPDRRVLGIDVAPTAVERFEELRDAAGVSAERAEVRVGDFFALDEAPFDLLWDYTFLCALEPARRGDWERKAHSLIADEGQLATLIFPAREEPLNGPDTPPYPLLPEDVEALLSPRWEKLELRRVEESHPGRQGLEWIARWRKR